MSCLLREVTASQLVAIATRSDIGPHNRLDLIHSLVPPHYVCNGYILFFSNLKNWKINIVKHGYKLNIIRKKLDQITRFTTEQSEPTETISTKQKQHNLHNHVILHVQLLRRSKNKKTVHIPMLMILHVITSSHIQNGNTYTYFV